MSAFDRDHRRALRRLSDAGAFCVTKPKLPEAVLLVPRGRELHKIGTVPRKTILDLYQIGALTGQHMTDGMERYKITGGGKALLERLLKEGTA